MKICYLPENNLGIPTGCAQRLKKYFLFLFILSGYLGAPLFSIAGEINCPAHLSTADSAGIGQIRTNLYLVENDNSAVLADGVLAEFNNIYSLQVDRNDALKFTNINETFAIQRFNYKLAAERRPELSVDDTVFYSQSRMLQRNYRLEFEVTGFEQTTLVGSLEDSYLHTSTPVMLAGTTIINFSVDADPASSAADRLKLVFRQLAVLPVKITSFAAYEKSNNNIALEWNVENELNVLKYDIEKSTDGRVFTKVNSAKLTGTSNTHNSYSWLDVNAVQGDNFYRIKTYDRNGETKYSAIVKVIIDKTESGFSIYPNPLKGGTINLRINNQPAGTYLVRLTNSIGQAIYTGNFRISGGSIVEPLKIGSKLRAGNYQLEVIGENNNHKTQKLIVK